MGFDLLADENRVEVDTRGQQVGMPAMPKNLFRHGPYDTKWAPVSRSVEYGDAYFRSNGFQVAALPRLFLARAIDL
jgi:hypothetical protein